MKLFLHFYPVFWRLHYKHFQRTDEHFSYYSACCHRPPECIYQTVCAPLRGRPQSNIDKLNCYLKSIQWPQILPASFQSLWETLLFLQCAKWVPALTRKTPFQEAHMAVSFTLLLVSPQTSPYHKASLTTLWFSSPLSLFLITLSSVCCVLSHPKSRSSGRGFYFVNSVAWGLPGSQNGALNEHPMNEWLNTSHSHSHSHYIMNS